MASMTERVTVAGYLAARLRGLGVGHLFGLPGDFNLALLDGMLDDTGLEWVGNTNELNAAYAADGYARRRGFAALVTTYGVGELSALNGVAGAFAESVPLVQITGAPATTAARTGALTHHTLADGDFDHFARAYGEVTVAAEVLTAADAPAQIDRVLTAALRESKPGYLAVPTDVAQAEVEAPSGSLAAPPSDTRALAELAASLPSGRLTLLVGHLAARRDARVLLRRITNTGLVRIATQLGAKGLVDEAHPAAVGVYVGGYSAERAREAIEGADTLVLVGTVLSDLMTGMFTHDVDPAVELGLRDARVGDHRFADLDLVDSLQVLADHLERQGKTPLPPVPAVPVVPATTPRSELSQAELWQTIQEWLPAGTPLLADAGTAYYGAAGLSLPPGAELVGQPIWSSIGYTLPALLGTALGDRTTRPVLTIGDGAAQLTVQELAVIAAQGLDPIVIVIDNAGYTVERAIRSPDAVYQDVTRWDWSGLATALGIGHTALAHTATELRDALRDAAPGETTLITAVVDRDDVPPLLHRIADGLSAPSTH